MSALKAFLEDFERPCASPSPALAGAPVEPQAEDEARRRELDEAYARGCAAGEAAAAERARLDQTALDSAAAQLSTALDGLSSDIKVQFCEALKTAVERVFPMLAERGFAESCAAAVAKAAGLGAKGPGSASGAAPGGARVTLKAAPSQAALLEEAFARLGEDGAIRIETDATLADLEIRAVWDKAGLDLNIEEAIRQAGEALDHTIAQIKDRT